MQIEIRRHPLKSAGAVKHAGAEPEGMFADADDGHIALLPSVIHIGPSFTEFGHLIALTEVEDVLLSPKGELDAMTKLRSIAINILGEKYAQRLRL